MSKIILLLGSSTEILNFYASLTEDRYLKSDEKPVKKSVVINVMASIKVTLIEFTGSLGNVTHTFIELVDTSSSNINIAKIKSDISELSRSLVRVIDCVLYPVYGHYNFFILNKWYEFATKIITKSVPFMTLWYSGHDIIDMYDGLTRFNLGDPKTRYKCIFSLNNYCNIASLCPNHYINPTTIINNLTDNQTGTVAANINNDLIKVDTTKTDKIDTHKINDTDKVFETQHSLARLTELVSEHMPESELLEVLTCEKSIRLRGLAIKINRILNHIYASPATFSYTVDYSEIKSDITIKLLIEYFQTCHDCISVDSNSITNKDFGIYW